MSTENQSVELRDTYDVAVLGAGSGGLAAAVFAALEGARVLLVERTEYVGGTSAYSAATTWVPNTRLAADVDAEDSPEKVSGYLDRAIGNRSPKAMREAFLANGPQAIHTLMDHTDAQFRARPFHPDYLYEIEGSTSCGRAIEPVPFDAKPLGRDLQLIRPTIPEFTILGGLQVDRDDIGHLLKMGKSLKSLAYSIKLIGGYYIDRLRFGRATRLVMGNALIGRLLLSARKLGVDIVTQTRVASIVPDGDGHLLDLETPDGSRRIRVSGGIILASGGFARHAERRSQMLRKPTPEFSPSAPGHTGELHDIVLGLGAVYGKGAAENAFMAPCSLRKRKDGTTAVFPHFVFDRSKPGIISVGKDGRRFTNESRSYHEFSIAQFETGNIPAFLIADARSIAKYGIGMVRPGTSEKGLAPFLDDGYLVSGTTPGDLARKLGLDAETFEQTLARFNTLAKAGKDEDFHRGETVYECGNGDPEHKPNASLGALETGPYYAVKLFPSDIGSATGLAADENARLIDADGNPIDGLYACGNDMQSIMGGVYPGPGITIGPAITFGYIAARHAAARAKSGQQKQQSKLGEEAA
ncbi:MAG: FAD-dependent oxidoreductase [Nitratireductor sp.]|nr:FAD-dependent oxidoreductase [Nitratireductor sp.]MCC0020766.1 FAD-dependent oxidoreductase [Nitratireductor sp.]